MSSAFNSSIQVGPETHTFGEPQWHADGALLALAYAADGALWSVEEPGILRQWNCDGRLLGRHSLSDLGTLWTFSPGAELLASASDDLVVWDVATQTEIASIAQPSWVTAVAFHPNCRLVATGHDDGSIRIWNLEKDGESQELRHHGQQISALAFSSDGSLLASASEDRRIGVWDLPSGKLRRSLSGHTDRIPALAFQPGTQLLVSAGWDTTARIWDLDSGDPLILLNTHSDQVFALSFSPNGRLLAVADSSGSVHIWSEIKTGKELQVLSGDVEEIRSLAFSPDGERLAVGGDDWVIHIWNPQSGELIGGQAFQTNHQIDLGFSPSLALVSNAGGTTLNVWDINAGTVRQGHGGVLKPLAVACSPNGRWLAATNAQPDSRLHIFDNQSKQWRPPVEGPRAPMTCATFSPDSTILATCCRTDGTAWLWNPVDGEPRLIIPEAAEGCTVEALAFHPNGTLLACGGIDYMATSGADGAVSIWNILEATRVTTFIGGAVSLAFDPSGRILAVASPESRITLWNIATQDKVRTLSAGDGHIAAISYNPDGTLLAAACDDHSLHIWNAASGQQIGTMELDTPPRALRFSPDGQTVYTGNGNTTCYAISVSKLLEA